DDRKKRFIIWLSVIFIFVCAILESSLAYIRDMSIIDSEVLIREIYDKEILFTELKYVPMIGGMMLGFIMPFVLVYIVIPLELFIYSLRIVIGKIIAYLMKCFKVVCFQLSIFIMGTGKLLIQFYDLIICLPLKLEAFVIKPVSKK
ncbi:MAG: hypothetical protein OEZ38_08265, partial [Gammaproteobacteria bacterium]|nr:hypothetical protein [Gammaproteobacteria bacterium]